MEKEDSQYLDKIVYRNYVAGDEGDIVNLLNFVFKSELTLSQWYWAHKENPIKRIDAILAFSGSKLIGQSNSIPLSFIYKGKKTRISRIQNVMVHPDFRGKGIFLETLRKLNGRLSEQKVDLIYAFPNDYSIGVFINKLDYCHLTDIFTMTLPLGSLKKNKNPDLRFDFQKNINFEQTDIDFISSRLQQYKIFNLRDADYLNWRYHKDSGKKYCVLRVFDQNKQVGLTVCKIYQKDMSIDLVEFFFNDDENLISSALRAIRDYHKSADIKLFSIWSMEHYSCYKYLFKMGFRRSGQATHFIYRIFSDSCSADCGKISSYYLSMGDSDVY